jgi:hypothetical protein
VQAAVPTFQNLTANDINGALTDFAAVTFPGNATTAGSYGKIFGFEAGVTGGTANSPNVDRLVSENVSKLPRGSLMLAASTLLGLGAEVNIMPIKVGGFEYDYKSLGVRWTFTDLFSILPVDMKIRFQRTSAKMTYQQTLSGVPVDVKYKSDTDAISLTIGKRILIVEPFVGFGYISGEHSLSAAGNATIFDTAVTASQRENIELNDAYYFLGVNFHLLIFNLGAELAKVYDNTVITGKLTFGF